MSRRARLGRRSAGAASAFLLAAFSAPAHAPRLTDAALPPLPIQGPGGDPIASAAPAFVMRTGGAAGADRPRDLTPQSAVPRVTLLYQNFPNPFPTALASETCLWFDLHRTTRVRLTIHGIRGNLVRTIIPSAQLAGELAAGRYGRGAPGPVPSCDPRFAWDGHADDGRMVPPGVYLVRLRTDSHQSFKKMLFRGR